MVYVGSKTGRDGIHGATMASAEFDDASEEKRPTVQVGDPFTEKLLLEACLELMATDAIIAIQDMGAAGLTSSSVEMADKGGVGIELDLDQVPTARSRHDRLRDDAVGKPGAHADGAEARPRSAGRARSSRNGSWTSPSSASPPTPAGWWSRHRGKVEADMPIAALADEAPVYERPWTKTRAAGDRRAEDVPAPNSVLGVAEEPAGLARIWPRAAGSGSNTTTW